MPYYSISLWGGDRADRLEVRRIFSGIESDYTGHENIFYVQRNYDIATMRRNVEATIPENTTVEVKRITKRLFNWRKHQ